MIRKIFHSSPFHQVLYFGLLPVCALSLGGFVYLFLRPPEYAFFGWIDAWEIEKWAHLSKWYSPSRSSILLNWIVYSLPNGLWAFSYAFIITAIWSNRKSWLRFFWLASIPILIIGFEMLQYTGEIPGTFCVQDLALGIIGLCLGYLLGKKSKKMISYEETSTS